MSLTREFYIPKDAKEIKCTKTDAVAYINDYADGTKYTAMVFAGKRSKYDKYYGFKTSEKRDQYVQEYFKDIAASYEKTKQYAEKIKAMIAEREKNYEVGGILYSAWGYDQTNIDYYQIIDRTDKMVTICKIGKKYLETEYSSEERVVPDKDNFVGEPMKKKIGAYGISLNSYANADLWDGQPKYQTAYGWGH